MSKANGGKMESFSRVAVGTVRKIWKEYFEDLYNIDTGEEVAVHKCGFDGIRRGNYFRGEPIERVEVNVRVAKLKNGKAVGKDKRRR